MKIIKSDLYSTDMELTAGCDICDTEFTFKLIETKYVYLKIKHECDNHKVGTRYVSMYMSCPGCKNQITKYLWTDEISTSTKKYNFGSSPLAA